MRILYITPSVQHPLMQASFRHYYFLRELARRHDITLLTLTNAPPPPPVLEELRRQTRHLVIIDAARPPRARAHRLLRPLLEIGRKVGQFARRRAALADMRRRFEQLVREGRYDVVVFHGHSVFSVIDGRCALPVVIDVCDARSLRLSGRLRHASLVTRPFHWLHLAHARHVEQRMVRASRHLMFISRRDREAILGATSRATVLPNAVDIEFWRRASPRPDAGPIVFHGAMDYRPNVDAGLYLIRTILPRLREARPGLELLIVGRDPLPELLDAAASQPGVTVTGAVSDIRPHLERGAVYTAPLRFGAGQQNKLLEAMAMELPVVASSNAAEGLRLGEEQPPVIIADDADRFAAEVLRLLDQPAECARLGAAGRRYIADSFSIEHSVHVLEQMCLDAVAAGPGRRAA